MAEVVGEPVAIGIAVCASLEVWCDELGKGADIKRVVPHDHSVAVVVSRAAALL